MFFSPKSDSSQDSEGESGDSRVLSQAEMAYIAIQVTMMMLMMLMLLMLMMAVVVMMMMTLATTTLNRWRLAWSTSHPTTMCTGTWQPGTHWWGTDTFQRKINRSGSILQLHHGLLRLGRISLWKYQTLASAGTFTARTITGYFIRNVFF